MRNGALCGKCKGLAIGARIQASSEKRLEKAQAIVALLADLNINQEMRNKIQQSVTKQEMFDYMFEPLRNELEVILHDPHKRFKDTNEFRKAAAKVSNKK